MNGRPFDDADIDAIEKTWINAKLLKGKAGDAAVEVRGKNEFNDERCQLSILYPRLFH